MKLVQVKEVTDYLAKKSEKGTPYIKLQLRCSSSAEEDANDPEDLYSFFLYMTEKSIKWSISNLKNLGFVGENLSVLETVDTADKFFSKNFLEQNPVQAIAKASVVTGDDGVERTYWNIDRLKTKSQQGDTGILGKFEGDFVKARSSFANVPNKYPQEREKVTQPEPSVNATQEEVPF